MKLSILVAGLLVAATGAAWAGQPTSNNFYKLETLKPFVTFLGFDRDKQEVADLQTRLQNSGTNWHCISDAKRLRCPLNGDTNAVGSNVMFRMPYQSDSGATLSEFHVTMIAEDQPTLSTLQPEIPVVQFLGEDWQSVVFALGKPTNVYDDGTSVQNLYCASYDLPSKPGEPHVARVYIMYVNVARSLGLITSVELAAVDQFLPPLAKPSC
jgi:hypothetical protein